ncbi:MAG: V-type proton ATPase subunit D [Caeruleum heppii]|nr:MAG: V-type proton ATPase subunit D [Caeruleum heppii]
MSGGGDREAVFPTRQSLGAMQGKLKGAQTGHSLLKRKSEALTKRFREITKRIDEAKRKMGRVMQIAAFSLAEVTYAVGGTVAFQIQESVKTARFRLRTKQENVSGVFLPQFESYTEEGNSEFGLTGLGKGGMQVQKCRETYARAVETLVELASLQVKNNKERDTAAADKEIQEKNRSTSKGDSDNVIGSADVLGDQDEDDVIF